MITELLCACSILIVCMQCKCDNDWTGLVNDDVDADRVYYLACVEEFWNYAPSGDNLITGESITSESPEAVWLIGNGVDRIGAEYIKGLYREFTNSCFTDQKERTDEEEHLGALGPTIRAISGETVKIYYKNKCSFPNSFHAHGLKYDKTSEGAPYDDVGINGGDIVPADGGQWIYIVEARVVDSEPASSKMWLYHSHVDEIRDVYAGMFGAIIVTKQGYETSSTDLMPSDVDREFVTFMVLYDENNSILFEKNLEYYLGDPNQFDAGLLDDEDFVESNLMHAINGYLFGNLDTLEAEEGERVRWYTGSFGNEGDGPHSPHWHGNIGVTGLGEGLDTVVIIPGTTFDVTMCLDNPGKWLYHCHVHDHIDAGMITTYTVDEEDVENKNKRTRSGDCDRSDDAGDRSDDARANVAVYKTDQLDTDANDDVPQQMVLDIMNSSVSIIWQVSALFVLINAAVLLWKCNSQKQHKATEGIIAHTV